MTGLLRSVALSALLIMGLQSGLSRGSDEADVAVVYGVLEELDQLINPENTEINEDYVAVESIAVQLWEQWLNSNSCSDQEATQADNSSLTMKSDQGQVPEYLEPLISVVFPYVYAYTPCQLLDFTHTYIMKNTASLRGMHACHLSRIEDFVLASKTDQPLHWQVQILLDVAQLNDPSYFAGLQQLDGIPVILDQSYLYHRLTKELLDVAHALIDAGHIKPGIDAANAVLARYNTGCSHEAASLLLQKSILGLAD